MDSNASKEPLENADTAGSDDPRPKFRFWTEGTPEVPPLMREILTKYSGIPDDQVVSHVISMRERAWAVHQYPCIGRFRFITFALAQHRLYERYILPKLQEPPVPSQGSENASPLYFEIGICLGQDVRALLYRGVPAARVFGTDLESDFIPLGYEMFRDEDRFPPTHQIAPVDLFDERNFASDGKLAPFLGKVDILHLTAVFHLWNLEKQVEVAKRVLRLMRRGGVILGGQTACIQPTEMPTRNGATMYRHNVASWEEMWMNQVTDDGVVTDTQTHVRGAILKTYTELFEVGPKEEELKGLSKETSDKVSGWGGDPGFRWMRFDVWVDPKLDAPVTESIKLGYH